MRQQRLTLRAANVAGYDAPLIAVAHDSSDAALLDHSKGIDTSKVCQPSGVIPVNLVKA